MQISRFTVDRPVFTSMFTCLVLVLGATAQGLRPLERAVHRSPGEWEPVDPQNERRPHHQQVGHHHKSKDDAGDDVNQIPRVIDARPEGSLQPEHHAADDA